jgi:transposase
MRRRKRSFCNCWIAIRASPGSASARCVVEIWFQDEARIGQKNSLTRVWGQTGSRPVAPKDLGFASAYVFGAVCPSQGKAAALIMPICNTAAMNHYLSEISSQVAADAHAVVILDGAGWHRSQRLVVPGNITLLELPPYSPELNPVERIWHYLRSHWLANSVFPSLAAIMDACEMAWNRFATDHQLIRSRCRHRGTAASDRRWCSAACIGCGPSSSPK